MEVIDINATFPEIVDYDRRIYAGMVVMLDRAVAQVTSAFKDAGLWQDTVLIFTSDNGGIGPGNNYPLRCEGFALTSLFTSCRDCTCETISTCFRDESVKQRVHFVCVIPLSTDTVLEFP